MRQLIVLLMGMVLLVGCASQATFGDAITEGEPTPVATPIIPNKPVYQVERGDVIYERRYFGRITPIITTELAFSIEGRVLETFAEVGQDVQEGDLLAVLDTSALEAQLLEAEADLAVAQSIFDSANNQLEFEQQQAQLNLQLAQLNLDYAISQAPDPSTAQSDFSIGVREIERDLAQLALTKLDDGVDPELRFDVTRAQNRVDDIQETITKAELYAPMTGQITSFPISAGDPVLAFDQIGIVADLTQLEVTEALDSTELSELSEGMPVTLQRANAPGDVFLATIMTLPEPFGSGNDELAHLHFDDVSDLDELSVGDRMSFTVVVEERTDVLWLPQSAIRQFSGRNFVVVETGGLQQRVDVKLGLENDDRVEILEGLTENQTVIGP